ncbi:MAG TPA: hypothetical protein DCP53_01845 [Elusimicrobia bacterium]|nr:hypothetical protein [Elusimicrobiota bacterium]
MTKIFKLFLINQINAVSKLAANLLYVLSYRLLVIRAGADVLQKFFGGRYLMTPTCPELSYKLKVKSIKFKVEGNDSEVLNYNFNFLFSNCLYRAGADVLQKFFGGRYLTTPTCPVVDSKKKDDGDKLIKSWN